MKKMGAIISNNISIMIVFLTTILMGAFALAQDTVIPAVSDSDFLGLLFQSLGGAKGATALSGAFLLSKLIMAFFGTSWSEKIFSNAGPMKLTLASGLNVVIGVLGLMTTSGLSLSAALVHSSVLAMGSVFVNQIYKEFFAPKDSTPAAPATVAK